MQVRIINDECLSTMVIIFKVLTDDKMDVSIEKSMSDMSLKDLPNDAQFLSEQEKALLQFKLSSVDKEIDKLQVRFIELLWKMFQF